MTIDSLIQEAIEARLKPLQQRIEQLEAQLSEPETGTLPEIAKRVGASYDTMRRHAKDMRRWKQGRAYHYYVEDWRVWFRERGEF